MASTPKKSPGPSASGRITPSSANRTPTSSLRSAAALNNSAQTPPTSSASTIHRSRGSIHGANGTPISARSAVKRPTPNTSASSLLESEDNNLREEYAQSAMDSLKERLEKAELAAAEMRRMNDVLQSRIDEAGKEQAKQEEKMQEDEERIEELENQKRELVKQKRELENIFEAERAQDMKSKELASAREEEMQKVIQRLKDSLSQKEAANKAGDESSLSRDNSFIASSSPTLDAAHFAPPPLQRSNSFRNNSKLLLQKDKLIEELRLELAELQIKLMELENKGGGRVHDLEKALIEARVTNARLMEENESFQSLLMEKTLNGDFSKHSGSGDLERTQSSVAGGTSLADELASIAESEQDQDSERYRRMELEVERQKAENKALTLYINKIIERILKHQGGFETILSNNDDEIGSPTTPAKRPVNKDKDLPPSPPKETELDAAGQSFLQRAKSLAYGRGRSAGRPQSTYIAPSPNPNAQPSVVENPSTAPSIPLQRSQSQRHSMMAPRRVQTSAEYNPGAAAVVGSMTRGGDSDVGSPRPGSYFGLMGRFPSGNRPPFSGTPTPVDERPGTSDSIDESDSSDARQAALDALTGGGDDRDKNSGIDTPSPPRSLGSTKEERDAKAAREQSVLHGNKIRPLRLVTEEQKKAGAGNRNSWMPNVSNLGSWFNNQGQPPPGGAPAP